MPPLIDFSQCLKCMSAYRAQKELAAEHDDDETDSMVVAIFHQCLSPIARQLDAYVLQLEATHDQTWNSPEPLSLHDTRLALRLAAACLAMTADLTTTITTTTTTTDNTLTVLSLIKEASCQWMDRVLRILACRVGDGKCRMYAARLYSNLVTSSSCADDSDLQVSNAPRIDKADESTYSWVDFIECALVEGDSVPEGRATLAAIVAVLYNFVLAEQHTQVEEDSLFVTELASSKALLCLLVRQLKLFIADRQATALLTSIDEHDEASEWILLLVERLVGLGQLPNMYHALQDADAGPKECFELNLLLACLLKNQVKLFGRSDAEAEDSLLFLASKYSQRLEQIARKADTDADVEAGDLRLAVACKHVELLADYLGAETALGSQMQLALGESTRIIFVAGSQLAHLVDDLLERNSKDTARKLTMVVGEQQTVTGLVRLLGNMAYRCPKNQDLLRTTLVAPKLAAKEADAVARHVLHVLLSCTSFAWACFTLREWALVAIRNALEGNDLNQALVADLQAQEAVQSASLTDMGIRVDLDNSGKVSVTPLDNPNKD